MSHNHSHSHNCCEHEHDHDPESGVDDGWSLYKYVEKYEKQHVQTKPIIDISIPSN